MCASTNTACWTAAVHRERADVFFKERTDMADDLWLFTPKGARLQAAFLSCDFLLLRVIFFWIRRTWADRGEAGQKQTASRLIDNKAAWRTLTTWRQGGWDKVSQCWTLQRTTGPVFLVWLREHSATGSSEINYLIIHKNNTNAWIYFSCHDYKHG